MNISLNKFHKEFFIFFTKKKVPKYDFPIMYTSIRRITNNCIPSERKPAFEHSLSCMTQLSYMSIFLMEEKPSISPQSLDKLHALYSDLNELQISQVSISNIKDKFLCSFLGCNYFYYICVT